MNDPSIVHVNIADKVSYIKDAAESGKMIIFPRICA